MRVLFDNVNVDENEILSYSNKVKSIVDNLESRKDKDDDFVGWLNVGIDKSEIDRIKNTALKIRKQAEVLLVIGIGGSYLGARAVDSALSDKKLEIIYVGFNLCSNYIKSVIDYIKDKDFVINVISKSGTTTEVAIAFRIFREILESRYNDFKDRIYITTDSTKGALRNLANKCGYTSFVIPNNIGGRYSLLTVAQLLPIACSGVDIEKLINGAKEAYLKYRNLDVLNNECFRYAISRNILYNKNNFIEILSNYDLRLSYFSKWWQQLFGESEGKDNKGIFPVNLDFTTDLHSMGQYIQEGRRNLFETVIFVDCEDDLIIKHEEDDMDNINYLEGKSINYINKMAMQGTITAHFSADVSNFVILLDKLDEFELGSLIFFFEYSCAISSMLMNVNPFNQPGVEEYKRNMFKLLNKPGF